LEDIIITSLPEHALTENRNMHGHAGQIELQSAIEMAVRREQAEADRHVLAAKEEALQQSQG
jgi:hypothetical protein